jgi:hypothetical protein
MSLGQQYIVAGFALLMFALVISLLSLSNLAYVFGGFGLFLVVAACFTKEENKAQEKRDTEE